MSETTAVQKAARDFVWTILRDCEHDFEGHDLPAIERYMVRRWERAALPATPGQGDGLDGHDHSQSGRDSGPEPASAYVTRCSDCRTVLDADFRLATPAPDREL